MSDDQFFEPPVMHQLKNHLSVVVSLCELLLIDLPHGPVREDVQRIHDETNAALALAPHLTVAGPSPVMSARDRLSKSVR